MNKKIYIILCCLIFLTGCFFEKNINKSENIEDIELYKGDSFIQTFRINNEYIQGINLYYTANKYTNRIYYKIINNRTKESDENTIATDFSLSKIKKRIFLNKRIFAGIGDEINLYIKVLDGELTVFNSKEDEYEQGISFKNNRILKGDLLFDIIIEKDFISSLYSIYDKLFLNLKFFVFYTFLILILFFLIIYETIRIYLNKQKNK